MVDQTKAPAKHLPWGNYARADWFEAECTRLTAELAAMTAAEMERGIRCVDLSLRVTELESALLWVKEHGSKHGMPAEVFAILGTVGKPG